MQPLDEDQRRTVAQVLRAAMLQRRYQCLGEIHNLHLHRAMLLL
jgi:hypothetical protein